MLESIRINGFKSYLDATLNLSPLTILIGENASGKSNAIEALKLLSWIAQGNNLGSIASTVQRHSHEIRGLVRELGHRGQDVFEFTCNSRGASWSQYQIRLKITADGQLFVDGEELSGPQKPNPIFRVSSSCGDGKMMLEYNSYSSEKKYEKFESTNQMPAMVQFENAALIDKNHKAARSKIPHAASKCRNELSKMTFIDPIPSKMRGYSPRGQKSLSNDGFNMSGILHQLCEDSESKNMIFEFVKSLPEQEIARIDFVETGRDEVMVRLTERFGGKEQKYDATLLSDGTLRVLAAAAAVLSAEEGSLVVVEEIDNGVHPSRAIHLLEKLTVVASARKLRILISTHNPALLDGLPISEISKVMVSYRNPDTGASKLIQMGDIQNFPILAAKGRPGQLMTNGTIDDFIKKNPGPEENRKRALSWIESFDNYESLES